MTDPDNIFGYIFWWDIPDRTALDYTVIQNAFDKYEYKQLVSKPTASQAFSRAIASAKTAFADKYHLDKTEKIKNKLTYGILSRTVKKQYKCKRVVHKHVANISFNSKTNKITGSTHSVCNFIINSHKTYLDSILSSLLTHKVHDALQEDHDAVLLSKRGSIWFVPNIHKDVLFNTQAMFMEILKKCGVDGHMYVQGQSAGGDMERAVYIEICRKYEKDLEIFVESAKHVNKHIVRRLWVIGDYLESLVMYRDLYAFDFDELILSYENLRNKLMASMGDSPNQEEKIRKLLGVN